VLNDSQESGEIQIAIGVEDVTRTCGGHPHLRAQRGAKCFGWVTTGIVALLPDRWAAAHPEHRLEQQKEESRKAQVRRRRKRAERRLAVAQLTM